MSSKIIRPKTLLIILSFALSLVITLILGTIFFRYVVFPYKSEKIFPIVQKESYLVNASLVDDLKALVVQNKLGVFAFYNIEGEWRVLKEGMSFPIKKKEFFEILARLKKMSIISFLEDSAISRSNYFLDPPLVTLTLSWQAYGQKEAPHKTVVYHLGLQDSLNNVSYIRGNDEQWILKMRGAFTDLEKITDELLIDKYFLSSLLESSSLDSLSFSFQKIYKILFRSKHEQAITALKKFLQEEFSYDFILTGPFTLTHLSPIFSLTFEAKDSKEKKTMMIYKYEQFSKSMKNSESLKDFVLVAFNENFYLVHKKKYEQFLELIENLKSDNLI